MSNPLMPRFKTKHFAYFIAENYCIAVLRVIGRVVGFVRLSVCLFVYTSRMGS